MSASVRNERRVNGATSKVNIDAAGILLRRILQAELATHFLDTRFDLLDMVRRMVSFADDPTPCQHNNQGHRQSHYSHMQMVLPMGFGVFNPLLEDLLRLLNKLAVKIDRVGFDAVAGVILAEDELRRLLVVLLHLATVGLSPLGQLLGSGAVAAGVGFLGLSSNVISLRSFRNRQIRREHTLSKHSCRFCASCLARPRRRSYSCSASPLWSWLKARSIG